MKLLVDTSVWSHAFRRDKPSDILEVGLLARCLDDESDVYVTGLILQELLQGFSGATARETIVRRFAALPVIVPEVADHVAAAELRNTCRRGGVQAGSIDALIAQLAIRHDLALLSTDNDFRHMARHVPIQLAT